MKKPVLHPDGAARWVRRSVAAMAAYVPGEQPRETGLIKLNTNENPYPPSSKVLAAVREATDQRLRLYPNPRAQALRQRLARLHRCRPENIVIGNGSDELLALAVRAFVEPAGAGRPAARSLVQYFVPSYSLYPVLADIHDARRNPVPLLPDFGLPAAGELRAAGWESQAALSLVTTPNAPSGRGYRRADLDALCRATDGIVLLDEAYVDFARESALKLALEHPHVLVARTFSKAYSLCFQRVGYLVGSPKLIEAFDKIRDSYNVNGLGQAAALATLDDLPYYRRNFRCIIATRQRLAEALTRLGFQVFPSQTNFLLVRPPAAPASTWLNALRDQRVLVRWFSATDVSDFLRITIGSVEEVDALLRAVRAILSSLGANHPSAARRRKGSLSS